VTEIYLFIIFGIVLNIPIGVVAYMKNSLTVPGGIVTAAIVGFTIFLAHYILWSILFLFFATSTILTKFMETSEVKIKAMSYAEKGGERDAIQVLANGGTAILGSIIVLIGYGLSSKDVFSPIFLFITVSLAATTADTWSTEIGTTSTSEPVWIFDLRKRVPRGTSGGVSLKGTTASFLGSLMVALFYFLLAFIVNDTQFQTKDVIFLILLIIGGFMGGMIDTLLGATVQAVFECPTCGKSTEKTKHPRCNYVKTNFNTGIKWLNNDGVNFLSAALASAISTVIYLLII
jgi:uncharacterized protein (TIGR00297 family)